MHTALLGTGHLAAKFTLRCQSTLDLYHQYKMSRQTKGKEIFQKYTLTTAWNLQTLEKASEAPKIPHILGETRFALSHTAPITKQCASR